MLTKNIRNTLNITALLLIINIFVFSNDKTITFQFDDGPTENTSKILEILKKYKAKAVFCVIGKNIERYPDIVKKIVQDGHTICNHSYSHPDMNKLTFNAIKNEIKKTNMLIKKHAEVDNYLYAVPYNRICKNYIYTISRFQNSKISDFSFNDTYETEINIRKSLKKHILSNLRKGNNKFILHLEHLERPHRIVEFDSIMDNLIKLKYTIKPDNERYIDAIKLAKSIVNLPPFISNGENPSIKIFNDKIITSKKIYLVLYGFGKYSLEIIKFMQQHNIPINIALKGSDTMLNLRYLNIIGKYKINTLIHFYSNELKCNALSDIDVRELEETQAIVYNLSGKIIKTAFIECPKHSINDRFITNLSKRFNKLVHASKMIGNNMSEYIYTTLTDKLVTHITKSFSTTYEMSLDEQKILHKLVKEFITSKKMNAFIKNKFNKALKIFVQNIKAGDVIVVGAWKRDILIPFKKIVKLLKNRGFTFDYIK